MSDDTKIKIAIAVNDDNYTNNIKRLLENTQQYQLVGTYKSISEILQNIKFDQPNILLLEKFLQKEATCKSLLSEISTLIEKLRILLIVEEDDHETCLKGIGAGAFGFIHKNSSAEKFFETIQDTYKNGTLMNKQILETIIGLLEKKSIITNNVQLTKREKQINILHTQGLNSKSIAEKLFISPSTVRTHLRNINAKLKGRYKKKLI